MPSISNVRLPSAILQKAITYSALIPETRFAGTGPYPVLYLFHPSGGDHSDWLVKTRIERYLKRIPLLVFMPSLGDSMGCDTASGEDYERFFIDEFIAHVEGTYHVRVGPDSTAVGGAGSGGYAAIRYALTYPYWFGTAFSHSGDLYAPREDRSTNLPRNQQAPRQYRLVFGDANNPRRKRFDLFQQLDNITGPTAPALYLDCGQEDALLAHNREFHRRLTTLRLRHEFEEHPGGHNWDFWDSRLKASLSFVANALGV